MRTLRLIATLAISAVMLQSCGTGGAGTTRATNSSVSSAQRISLGYYTEYQGVNYSYHSVESYSSYINAVSAEVFSVDGSGAINGSIANGQLMTFNKANGIETFASVRNYANGGFQSSLAHSAVVDNATIVIGNLVSLVQSKGFAGVDVDFENLDPADRDAYSAFVHNLAAGLHAAGYKLVLSVPAKQSDSATDTWTIPFDFEAIGQDADFLQMMTYDQHAPGQTGPGPVSGSDWVEACIQYAITVVPSSKLLIGLPAYGYDWEELANGTWVAGNSTHGLITWTNSPSATASWSATSNSPYVIYTDINGLTHQAWFENQQSIRIKSSLVQKYNLGGISMWSLGDENLSFWQATSSAS